MKAKLIKTEVNYLLENEEGVIIASTSLKKEGLALSLKNCQAVERGYDLYELAKENYHKFWSVADESEMLDHTFGYVEGFQKALEILGKFSEEDMMKFGDWLWRAEYKNVGVYFNNTTKELFEIWKSLQQNEWEVEVEMEEVAIGDKYTPEPKPKLDEENCLILKRL